MSNHNGNNKTVNQHYVPRCYMKNFSTITGTGNKEKALIVFYQFNKQIVSNKVPTKTICYEKYFYGEDGKIEKEFALKESIWAAILNKVSISTDYFISEDEERQIKDFAIYQYGRTLAMFKYGKEIMEEMLISHLANITTVMDKETIKNMVDERLKTELNASDVVNCCENLLRIIDDLKISIIRYKTINKLITSDMPVIITNPFCTGKAGLSNVGVVIFFPISSDTLVIIYDSKVYSIEKFVNSENEEDVRHLNKYQVLSAEERILAHEKSELLDYIEDTNLLNDREERRNKGIVSAGLGNGETFFAIKSRALDYKYKLSFCRLPRKLRKIPKVCREALERKYSKEARLYLLCMVYRGPDLLKSIGKSNAIEISKMKDGYSKMQKFMDDYWKIPIKERIITPEMMYKLKTVPSNMISVDWNR